MTSRELFEEQWLYEPPRYISPIELFLIVANGFDGSIVPVEYHVTFWKSELIDFVILQQDAFDEIDAVTPMERQEAIVNMVIDICHTEFEFDNFNEVMDYFKKMINVCKQMNYSKFKSPEYDDFVKQLNEPIQQQDTQPYDANCQFGNCFNRTNAGESKN